MDVVDMFSALVKLAVYLDSGGDAAGIKRKASWIFQATLPVSGREWGVTSWFEWYARVSVPVWARYC